MSPSRDPREVASPKGAAGQRASSRSKRVKAARERAEQLRREHAQQRARRKRVLVAAAATAIVVVAVAAMVVVSQLRDDDPPATKPVASGQAANSVVTAATSVPPGILDQVGKGAVLAKPQKITNQPELTADGKPLVLYVGAEYCPFCATQRWAVVVAMSRFGTFSDLGMTHSASDDVYPNTQSFSFHGSSYRSEYLAFQGLELSTNELNAARDGYVPLDKPTEAQQRVIDTLNAPPYTSRKGSIPFMDMANKYTLVGGAYKAEILQNKTHQEIAAALSDPNSAIAKGILGTANMFTAYLCQLTGGQPGEVCGSPAVKAFAEDL